MEDLLLVSTDQRTDCLWTFAPSGQSDNVKEGRCTQHCWLLVLIRDGAAVSVAGDRGAPPKDSSAPVGCKHGSRGADNKIGDGPLHRLHCCTYLTCQRPSVLAPHHKRDKRYTNLFTHWAAPGRHNLCLTIPHHASTSLSNFFFLPPFLSSIRSNLPLLHTSFLLTTLTWHPVLRTLASRPLRSTSPARFVLLLIRDPL